MKTTKINPLIRLFPSLTDIAFLMPIMYLFAGLDGAKTMLSDGDTGWHIRTGEWILSNGRVPTADMFSFTKAGEPWYAWEWLWDVLFAWMHQHWGMESVVIASVLMLCTTAALLYRLVDRTCGNALISAAVTFTAVTASALHWLARPHLVTLLFTIIFLSILARAHAGRVKLLFVLPLLMVLWTNLHGGFLVGIILIGGYAAGELLEATLEPSAQRRRELLARSVPYLLAAGACLLATFVNPYTYNLHVHIFEYLREPYHQENIIEFLSPSFHPVKARYFEVLLALGVVASCWKMYRREFAPALLILFWAHAALFSARNIPIYVLVASPAIAQALTWALGLLSVANVAGWFKRSISGLIDLAAGIGHVDRIARLHVVSACGLMLVAVLMYSPVAAGKLRAAYDSNSYPERAMQTDAIRSAGAIFTDDEWGDYLIYRLYPRTKVFIDGRSDFYGPVFGKAYLDVLAVKHNWERTLSQYRVDAVLLRADSALSGALKQSSNWRTVYDDGMAIVFRPAPSSALQIAVSEAAPTGSAGMSSGKKRDRGITSYQQAVISRSLNPTN
jgi:hypothetical protein